MGLEGGIWASRLGFRPQGWDMGLEAWERGGYKGEEDRSPKGNMWSEIPVALL